MAERPQSLGDVPKPDLVLTRSTEPLPQGRREIVAKFEGILNRGGVQKVTVELGKPIEIVQFVDKSTLAPPMETPSEDLWDLIRNTTLEELRIANGYTLPDAYELLFHAFALFDKKKLKAQMLFVHDYKLLRTWLRLHDMFPMGTVFGVETAVQSGVPEDAVILVGLPLDEDNTQDALGLRIPVDLPVTEVVVPIKAKR
jgi:hypothetical protein